MIEDRTPGLRPFFMDASDLCPLLRVRAGKASVSCSSADAVDQAMITFWRAFVHVSAARADSLTSGIWALRSRQPGISVSKNSCSNLADVRDQFLPSDIDIV